MRIFKPIWYSLLAVLLIVSFSLGISSAYSAGSAKNVLKNTSLESVAQYESDLGTTNQRDYINDTLIAANFKESVASETDGNVTYNAVIEDGKPVPTFALQQQALNSESWEALARRNVTADGEYIAAVNTEPQNIVVYLPGTDTKANPGTENARAVLFYARYNKEFSDLGSNIPVSSMLINAIEGITGSYKNDIIFLFSDAADGKDFGIYNFVCQFDGFYNVVSRIDCVIDLDSLGGEGALNLIKAVGSYGFVSKVNAIAGKGVSSSLITPLYESSVGKTDSDLFERRAYAKIANSNGLNFYNSASEEKISETTLSNYANAVGGIMNELGNADLGSFIKTSDTYCFNLFGLSMALPYFVAYIFAALIVVLLAAVILVNMKKKAFSLSGAGKGAAVQLICLLCTAAIMFILYYLMLLVLSLLTVIPVNAITALRYSGPGIIVCLLLLSIPVIIGSQMIFKKLFNCKAADIVRGNVLLLAVIGIIFAFLPLYGFVFSVLAVLELIVMLITVSCQQKYIDKYNDSIGKLFLYLIPVILFLPVFLYEVAAITAYSYLVYLPLLSVAFALLLSFATPYFGMIKPAMQKLVDKLPKRVIRVSKTVTEKLEDRAKKGKFTERTVTKVEKQYVDRKYRNRYLVIALTLILIVVNLFVGGIGANFGKNITLNALSLNSIYKNSLIYVYDADSDNSYFEVYDHLLYKNINYAIDDFEWDSEKQAYVKNTAKLSDLIENTPIIGRDENTYNVTIGNNRAKVKLDVSGIDTVTKITVISTITGDEYEIELDRNSKIELLLPTGFGSFDLVMEGLANETNLEFTYTETLEISGEDLASRYAASSEWEVLSQYGDFAENVLPYVKGGLITTMTKNI